MLMILSTKHLRRWRSAIIARLGVLLVSVAAHLTALSIISPLILQLLLVLLGHDDGQAVIAWVHFKHRRFDHSRWHRAALHHDRDATVDRINRLELLLLHYCPFLLLRLRLFRWLLRCCCSDWILLLLLVICCLCLFFDAAWLSCCIITGGRVLI